MEFFKLNGTKIAAPTEISISLESLDKVERTMDGTMVVDIIGEKRSVEVTWEYLSKEDMTKLSTAVKNSKFVNVSFHDKETGNLVTMEAHGEGLTYLPYFDWVKNKLLWKTVSIVFREK